jgi:hypothetical protein
VDKTNAAIAQFSEESDCRGIGERDVRQFERNLNIIGKGVHIARCAKLVDPGPRYPAFNPKSYRTHR